MTADEGVLQRSLPSFLMVASGFAGLGYQVVWTEQCSLWLGHETAAVLAVVAAFFGGLAVGGLLLGSRIEQSSHPVRWYAGCELVIALWSLLLIRGLPSSAMLIERAVGVEASPFRQWALAFGGTFVAFLPATAAMGATLPAMERLLRGGRHGSLATLYAWNTFGAVLGVLGGAFWLIPSIGLVRSAVLCSALNLSCALLAFVAFGARSAGGRVATPAGDQARPLLVRLAATGFLGIGYEVTVVRVLGQVTEDTVYTFALLLAVYLIGTAAGAAAYRRWVEPAKPREALGDQLFSAAAIACLLGTVALFAAEELKGAVLDVLGGGVAPSLGAEACLALAAFGAPTLVMGALFSHLSRSATARGVSFGRALGVNTLAAAAAPVVCGVLAVPAFGPKLTLLALVVGYLACTTGSSWLTKGVVVPAAAALAVALFAPPLRFVQVPEGGKLASYVEGALGAVSVSEDGDGTARLYINNRQQEGSSRTLHVDARQAWLPLLLHRAPRRALFLGLGTGVTATSALADPTLAVEVAELLPEVIAASTHFTGDLVDDAARARLRTVPADARRYVRAGTSLYDVIVSDNFHPARSGSGALYTVEHFERVRRRLAADGIFCQWLPLHQLDLPTLRAIVRSFLTAFPEGAALLASNSLETPVVGLLGGKGTLRYELATVRERLARARLPPWWSALGLDDEYAVLGSFIASPAALGRFAQGALPNTDDRPVVAYSAPRAAYAPEASPRDRLTELLSGVTVRADEVLRPAADPSGASRLDAYILSRDYFLQAGRSVHPSPRVEEMLAQVREPLLSALRISPDFRPAYDPLISMAGTLARSNVGAARALLAELRTIQPARTEASHLLLAIDNVSHASRTDER